MNAGDPVPHVEFFKAPGGTGVKVNGQEIPEVTKVSFEHSAHQLARVTLETIAWPGIEFSVPASVDIRVYVAAPGCTIEEREVDGVKQYRCVQSVG